MTAAPPRARGHAPSDLPCWRCSSSVRVSGLCICIRTTRQELGSAQGEAGTTIAVLPFANLSSDAGQENFTDGITEEILNSLSRIRGLQVTGRTSSFFFKGRNEDMRHIGEQLGVAHLLEGSVRRDGNQLRITAQLVKAKDGFHLWSQTYDRPMDDIFKVQEDIARAVAEALQVTLGVGELGEMPGMTHNMEAYEHYLEGMRRTAPWNQARSKGPSKNFARQFGWTRILGRPGEC